MMCAEWRWQTEHGVRLAAVRAHMAERGIDTCLVSTPENIFYLTGLDHWGYFAPHLLIVPMTGQPVLVARAMERVTVANQVKVARFEGYDDSETAASAAARVLRPNLRGSRVGLEMWSNGLPYGLALTLQATLPGTEWLDITGMVDGLRLIKSAGEQSLVRQAARVSDCAAAAAIDAIRVDATERDVAAACQRAMIEAGGSFPGFGPFIRSTNRLGEEHTSWGDAQFGKGDVVFLELSGCVARYHAPLGRLVHVGPAPREVHEMAAVSQGAFHAVLGTLREGVRARDVYAAWQGVVDRAGLSHYRRHHCGYLVGIGIPPSWTGGNSVVGLRHDSDLEIRTGMTFHILSWLMGTGRGDFFLSNTVVLSEGGPEVLTNTPMGVIER